MPFCRCVEASPSPHACARFVTMVLSQPAHHDGGFPVARGRCGSGMARRLQPASAVRVYKNVCSQVR